MGWVVDGHQGLQKEGPSAPVQACASVHNSHVLLSVSLVFCVCRLSVTFFFFLVVFCFLVRARTRVVRDMCGHNPQSVQLAALHQ